MQTFARKENKAQEPTSADIARSRMPTPGPSHRALELQRVIGNAAVGRMLRTQADLGQTAVPPIVGDVVHSIGIPLDPAIGASSGARLGLDFSHVRVHTDETAARSADTVRARAYTVGSHIVFARGAYEPQTPEGAHLIRHELVHVAQQSGSDAAPTPRTMTHPHDASEREAHALATHGTTDASPMRTANTLGPVVARLDVEAVGLEESRLEALRHGLDPNQPASKPLDPLEKELREAVRNPQPRAPEPTVAGDPIQQAHALPKVYGEDLWTLPRIQDEMTAIAAATEAREQATMKAGGKVKNNAADMMEYWKQHFISSVEYILYIRNHKRDILLAQLRAQEETLAKSAPADLVVQVEALRRTFKDRWQHEVDRAADGFVIVARNESLFLTEKQAAKPVRVSAPDEIIEGTVTASAHPDTMVYTPGKPDQTSAPVAPSVVRFMKAVQKETGKKAKADNYAQHEEYNPPYKVTTEVGNIGKYSFDVDLQGLVKINAEGFYDREQLFQFFLGVDRAAKATQIEWVAFYNDFAVAKQVNEELKEEHIHFSGGGSAGTGKEGSIHHGPAPYILHVHVNIMPTGDLEPRVFVPRP